MGFWTGADETIGHAAMEMSGGAVDTDEPAKRRAPMQQYGFKHRKYWTPAGEPTPATKYMQQHSMTTGDPLIEFLEQGHVEFSTPELALRYAVLEEALKDFGRHWHWGRGHTKRPRFAEAKKWIWDTSDEAKAWPFSFINICNALDIDGDELKRRLGVLYARHRKENRGWTRLADSTPAT